MSGRSNDQDVTVPKATPTQVRARDHEFSTEAYADVEKNMNSISDVVAKHVEVADTEGAEAHVYAISQLCHALVTNLNLNPDVVKPHAPVIGDTLESLIDSLENRTSHDDDFIVQDGGDESWRDQLPAHLRRQPQLEFVDGSGSSPEDAKAIGQSVTVQKGSIRLPFFQGWTAEQQGQSMASFAKWLQDERMESLIDRQLKWTRVAPVAAEAVAHVLFVQMTSSQAVNRFNSLIRLNTLDADSSSAAVTPQMVIKATNLSKKTTLPEPVRKFFGLCSEYWSTIQDKNAQYFLNRDLLAVRVYTSYVNLKSNVAAQPAHWNRIFLREGITPRAGADIATRVIDLLCSPSCLDVGREVLKSRLRQIEPTFRLFQEFGRGVLVLFPKEGPRTVSRASGVFWPRIIKEFKKRVPEFKELCTSLDNAVIKPILENRPNDLPQPVDGTVKKTDSLGGVYDRLMDACGEMAKAPMELVDEINA